MMRKPKFLLALLAAASLTFTSCEVDLDEPTTTPEAITPQEEETPSDVTALASLDIPEDFTFETDKQMAITINDTNNGRVYKGMLGEAQLFAGVIVNGSFSVSVKVPAGTEQITLVKYQGVETENVTVTVAEEVSYTSQN